MKNILILTLLVLSSNSYSSEGSSVKKYRVLYTNVGGPNDGKTRESKHEYEDFTDFKSKNLGWLVPLELIDDGNFEYISENRSPEDTFILPEAKTELVEDSGLAEERRVIEEARKIAEARSLEEARLAEEARLVEEARVAEEARILEVIRLEKEAILAEEKRVTEEARLAREAIAEEERRLAEEARLAEGVKNAENIEREAVGRKMSEVREKLKKLNNEQKINLINNGSLEKSEVIKVVSSPTNNETDSGEMSYEEGLRLIREHVEDSEYVEIKFGY